MTDETLRERLGALVARDRRQLYGTVDKARIAAKINTATWNKVEAGKPVAERSLTAVQRALNWPPDRALQILAGAELSGAEEGGTTQRMGDPVVDAIEASDLSRPNKDRLVGMYWSLLDHQAASTG